MFLTTRKIPAAILAALVLCLPALAQALPIVNFAQTTDSTTERHGNHYLPVVVSGGREVPFSVYIRLSSETAEPGQDFVSGTTLVNFYPDGSDTAYASVQLYDDFEAEEDEYITLTIQENSSYYEMGEPSSMVLTLIDDDVEGPAAHFVVEPDVPLSIHGDISLAVEPGTDVELTIEIDALPPEGATVLYAVDGIVTGLPFTNQTRQTITVPGPQVDGGAYHGTRDVAIIGTQGGKTTAGGITVLGFDESLMGGNCLACALGYMFSVAGYGYCVEGFPSCGLACDGKAEHGTAAAGNRSTEDDLAILRNYRDNILLGTAVGDYYVQLHQDLQDDLFAAILADPTLVSRGREVWNSWIPVAGALVDGQGDETVITEAMMGQLLGLMDGLAEVGTPTLVGALTDLREGMGLDDGPPASAGEFQVRVETSSTSTRHEAWDGVKAMYR